MKRKLLILILLLTGIGYLFSVLELDSKECSQNYSKETHTYICSKSDTHHGFHIDFTPAVLTSYHPFRFAEAFSRQIYVYHFAADPHPPERLYLRHLVLLI